MRQVPRYLLVGGGRVARHFQSYLSMLNLPFETWHRGQSVDLLADASVQATHILILINDDAIDDFIKTFLLDVAAMRIHFSGSLVSELAYGAHPLMTFSNELYDLSHYQAIPFVLDEDAPEFSELLPGLLNAHVRLSKSVKSKYHALCVLSGNFSCLLWQKLFHDFERELGLPRETAFPYLQQQTKNLLANADAALTGPLVRHDHATIQSHLTTLSDDPVEEVYRSFVTWYQTQKGGVCNEY